MQKVLCKANFGNFHLEMGVCKWEENPLCLMVYLTTKEMKIHLQMKGYVLGRKWVFKNWVSHYGGPL